MSTAVEYRIVSSQSGERYACAVDDGFILAAVGPLLEQEANHLASPEAIATRIDRGLRFNASDALTNAQRLEGEANK